MSWAQLPPHDLEAEAGAISAVLWGDCCAHELEADDFWSPEYREIWAVVATLEEVLGCDVGWRLRWWAALRLLPALQQRRRHTIRLLEIVGVGWDGPLRTCLDRLKELARQRLAVRLLVAAEVSLRETSCTHIRENVT